MYDSYNFPGQKDTLSKTIYTMSSTRARFEVTYIGENCHSLYLNSFCGPYEELLPLLEKLAIWAGNRYGANYTNFYLTTNQNSYTTIGLNELVAKCKFIKCGKNFTNRRTGKSISMYRVDIKTLIKTIKELECSQ